MLAVPNETKTSAHPAPGLRAEDLAAPFQPFSGPEEANATLDALAWQ